MTHIKTYISEKESLDKWAFQGSVKKAYDKSCKGFVLILDHNTKAQMPKDSRNEDLSLVQPYIILQLMITDKKFFNIEITVSDPQKIKRRLIFNAGQCYSYSKDNIIKQPLHTRIPCDLFVEGIWLNLQLDITNLNEKCFGQFNYRSIDSIVISGSCRLRKVFTSKYQIPDSSSLWLESQYGEEIASDFDSQFQEEQYKVEDISTNLNFGVGIDFLNQVISYERIIYWGYLNEQISTSQIIGDVQRIQKPAIVFGTRVTSKPILESRQQIQTALSQVDKLKHHYSPKKIIQGSLIEGIIHNAENIQNNQQNIVMKKRQLQQRSQDVSPNHQSQKYQSASNNISAYNIQRNTSDNSRDSASKSILPLSIQGGENQRILTMEDESNFDQYNKSPSYQQNREFSLPYIKSKQNSNQQITRINSRVTNARIHHQLQQPMNDDQIINQKLRELELARQQINSMAYRYNLENNQKIDQFSLLTILHPSQVGHHHMSQQDPESMLYSTDQKGRVWEYHEKVNNRRQRIHQRQLAKKKSQQQDAQSQVLDEKQILEDLQGIPGTGDKENKRKSKQEGINEKDKIEGWEGENDELEGEGDAENEDNKDQNDDGEEDEGEGEGEDEDEDEEEGGAEAEGGAEGGGGGNEYGDEEGGEGEDEEGDQEGGDVGGGAEEDEDY